MRRSKTRTFDVVLMRYRLTTEGRRREHISYLTRIVIHAALVIGAFLLANLYFHPEDRVIGNVLASLLVLGGYAPWRNYILYLRYEDSESFIEVDGTTLWLSNRHFGRTAFPLNELSSFVHKKRDTEVLELRTAKGDELDLRDYENMARLVEDLRRSPAGSKYEVKA